MKACQKALCTIGALLGMTVVGECQLTLGSDLSVNGNGNVSAGYAADFGDNVGSDHSFTFGGQGNFSGFYFDPKFLSFDITPYMNQSRANSNSQSISDASGVTLTSSVFSGSHFPGSFSYQHTDDSESNYGLPGLSGFTTRGDSNSFGVSWGAYLPGLPTLNIGFVDQKVNYDLYGSSQAGESDSKSFYLFSNYTLAGFALSGGYRIQDSNSLSPVLVSDAIPQESNTSSDSFNASVGHRLPWHGNSSLNFTHTGFDEGFSTTSLSGAYDVFSASANVAPLANLQISTGYSYNTNLVGSMTEQIIDATGATVLVNNAGQDSHTSQWVGNATYVIMKGFSVGGTASYTLQAYQGMNYSAEGYAGNIGYATNLFGGSASESFSVSKTITNASHLATLGYQSSTSYSRRVARWMVTGNFNYSQNATTALLAYTSSGYAANGSVNRAIGRFHWNASASFNESKLNEVGNSVNKTMSYSTGFGGKYVGVSGGYAHTQGESILTATGLTTSPVPLPVLSQSGLILLSGTSYSASLGITPRDGLTGNASFSHTESDSSVGSAGSLGKSSQITAFVQYRFRKVFLNAGYTKFNQSFSTIGLPGSLSSYYFGIQRWFNFF